MKFHLKPTGTAVWLDDIRDPSSRVFSELLDAYAPRAKVVWVKTVEEFKKAVIEADNLVAVFFDNDLGYGLPEGKEACAWFEDWVYRTGHGPVSTYAQTGDTIARREMQLRFRELRRHWRERG